MGVKIDCSSCAPCEMVRARVAFTPIAGLCGHGSNLCMRVSLSLVVQGLTGNFNENHRSDGGGGGLVLLAPVRLRYRRRACGFAAHQFFMYLQVGDARARVVG